MMWKDNGSCTLDRCASTTQDVSEVIEQRHKHATCKGHLFCTFHLAIICVIRDNRGTRPHTHR